MGPPGDAFRAAAARSAPSGGAWTDDELRLLGSTDEIRIATRRRDGTARPWVPIWVVCVDRHAYVRTWHRRGTGWFGSAASARRARVRVSGPDADLGLEADLRVDAEVEIDDVGAADSGLRRAVDEAYRRKYRRYGAPTVERMTTDDAAAATLRLVPRADADRVVADATTTADR